MIIAFLDWIGDVAWAGLIYHSLNNWPGLLLLLLATIGMLVFLWKHKDASDYRFNFRRIVDVWAMVMITTAYGAGLWLMFFN